MTTRPNLTILTRQASLTEAELSAIEARATAASDGPWGWWEIGESGGGWVGSDVTRSCAGLMPAYKAWGLSQKQDAFGCGPQVMEFRPGSFLPIPEDAEFIAHARMDIPRLVAEVRRLRRQLETEQGAA